MSNEKNETLKPGDRVRILSILLNNSAFFKDSFSYLIGNIYTVHEDIFFGNTKKLAVHGAAIDCFTYEKIQEDGNG